MKSILLLVALALVACAGAKHAGDSATPIEASIVVMRSELNADLEVEYKPVCMGVAVSSSKALTASHCLVEDPFYVVDYPTWYDTAAGKTLATAQDQAGQIATVVPRAALPGWVPTARAVDGLAEVVRLRGSDFVSEATTISETHIHLELAHGDSGSGVFQNGALVGIVNTCDGNGDGVTCVRSGGDFARVIP